MKKTLVIFKKELKDMLRDRRTIIMMVVIPLLVFPLIINIMAKVQTSQAQKARQKILKVGLVTNGSGARLKEILTARTDMEIDENIRPQDIEKLVQDKKKDFVLVLEDTFDQRIEQQKSGRISLYYKSSRSNDIAARRVTRILEDYKKELVDERLQALNLERSFIDAVVIERRDLVSVKEKLGEAIGGLLPYIFVIFCFLGAMYPAIDLAAGEKERATIETLLASPVGRLQIVMGKFLVVTLAGLTSAAIAMLGLYLSLQKMANIPERFLNELMSIIEPRSVILLLSLLLPLCVFFAAVLLSISIFARSFKEAQSAMAPMNFVVIIPAAIGIMPGIKLTALTAAIPILNVCLATREIIAGTVQTALLLETFLSLFVLAGLSLYFCTTWFKRESVIFRGT